ncbi:MAG: PEGA domain-containing protein [Bdellovibrionota bacterium]
MNKRVITMSLPPESFSCENVLAAARILVVDSIPPFADVYINERKIGEAPIWTSLDDGTYEVQCQLPDDIFPKKTIQMPGTAKHLCKRENLSMRSLEADHDRNAEAGEKNQQLVLVRPCGRLIGRRSDLAILILI